LSSICILYPNFAKDVARLVATKSLVDLGNAGPYSIVSKHFTTEIDIGDGIDQLREIRSSA